MEMVCGRNPKGGKGASPEAGLHDPCLWVPDLLYQGNQKKHLEQINGN